MYVSLSLLTIKYHKEKIGDATERMSAVVIRKILIASVYRIIVMI